jgi:hypothetical protein
MGGIEILEKLLALGSGRNNLLKISGLKCKLWIEGKNRGALLSFGRCGYFRYAILQNFEILGILIRVALTQLVDNEILAHWLIIIEEKE